MYYVARGSIPQQRHTQHRAPDGSLYAEELFGVEGFTGRSSLLYHLVPPTRTHRIEPVRRDRARGGRRRAPSPPPDEDRRRSSRSGDAISGRIPLYFNRDVVFGVVRPAEPMPDGPVLPQRRRRRDALRPRGERRLRHDLRAAPLRPGRLPRPPDRHDLAPRSGPGLGAADALPGGAVGDRAAEALSQRLRPAPRALAVQPARPPRPDVRRAARRGRATSSSTSARRTGSPPTTTGTIRSTSSAGTATSGRSASTSPTSSRSPGASTSRRRSTRRSRRATSWSARSCPASSTTTRWRSRRRTTTRTSTATRSSTTSPATS